MINEWLIPEGKVKLVSVGGVVLWKKKEATPENPENPEKEQLAVPTITIEVDVLTITTTDNRTEEFVILVDGVEMETVENVMAKEFDLSTLNLSVGTHEITVKARANGYVDSVASNAVSYVVEGYGEETLASLANYSISELNGMALSEFN